MYKETEDTRVSSFPDRVKEAMAKAEMKPADLIRVTGLHKSAIYRYLSGKYEPKQKAISSMAVALDVSEMWLYGYDVPMERSATQKKNDQLVGLIVKMRSDADFLGVVSMLSELPEEQYASVKSIILSLGKK